MNKSFLIVAIVLLISAIFATDTESETLHIGKDYAIEGPTIGRLDKTVEKFKVAKPIFS